MQENELVARLGHKKCTDNFDNRVESAHRARICCIKGFVENYDHRIMRDHFQASAGTKEPRS